MTIVTGLKHCYIILIYAKPPLSGGARMQRRWWSNRLLCALLAATLCWKHVEKRMHLQPAPGAQRLPKMKQRFGGVLNFRLPAEQKEPIQAKCPYQEHALGHVESEFVGLNYFAHPQVCQTALQEEEGRRGGQVMDHLFKDVQGLFNAARTWIY